MNKKIIIISGFSGVGKGTVLNELIKLNHSIEIVRSCTTRPPRMENEFYNFLPEHKFQQLFEEKEFLEVNSYGNYKYGTLKRELNGVFKTNKLPLLEIDYNGYSQVSGLNLYEIVSIFIVSDAYTILERINKRGKNTTEEIISRFENAINECWKINEYSFVLRNDDSIETAKQINNILNGLNPKDICFDSNKFCLDAISILENLKATTNNCI